MTLTTPNKEIVRRICHLHKATKCFLYLDIENKIVEVLANITLEKVSICQTELESWAGMTFKVYNYNTKKDVINKIITRGEQILPIEL